MIVWLTKTFFDNRKWLHYQQMNHIKRKSLKFSNFNYSRFSNNFSVFFGLGTINQLNHMLLNHMFVSLIYGIFLIKKNWKGKKK